MTVAVLRRLLAVLITGLVVAGCQSSEPTGEQVATGIENAQLRTDREPIQKRFPQLGAFSEVHWLGGRLGDDRAPGPSTYFIEAAVTLTPTDAAALRERYSFQTSSEPQPPEPLSGYLTGDGWTASPELNSALASSEWAARVYLRPDAPIAYLTAKGS